MSDRHCSDSRALLLCLRELLGNKKQRSRRRHPLVVTVFHQFLHMSRLHDYHTDLARRHGSFRLFHPTNNYIFLVHHADVEYILRTNFSNYGKGSFKHGILSDLLGDGIFAADSDNWRHQRKLASFEFSTRNLRDYGSDVFRRKAVQLALVISEATSSYRPVEIQGLLMKSTLDSIFKVGFGVELDTISGSKSEGSRFAKAFDGATEVIFRRYSDVFWKIKRLLNVGAEAALKEHLKVIDKFVYEVIQRKTQLISAQRDCSMKEDILSRFLAQSDQGVKMSSKYLRDVVLNLVIAGRDTTAGTLSWFFFILCKHPDVQEKVAQEVATATEADSAVSMMDFAAVLTEDSLNKMQYLYSALTESLRLYPAVPVDPKACFSDDTLPSGNEVREGETIWNMPYTMGRMKHLWGEDAEEFRPERWLDGEGAFQPESPFKFTAFQAGPRVCLGKDFAYRQMKIFAAVLVYFFTFELKDAAKEVHYRSSITLQVDEGLPVRAFPRRANA